MNTDQIIQVLNDLANKLTPPAQHVWDLAMRQMIIINGISAVISIVAVVIVFVVDAKLLGIARKNLQEAKEQDKVASFWDTKDSTASNMVMASVAAIGGVTFVGGIVASGLISAIPVLLNPEWAVLMQIKDLVPVK